MEKTLKLLHDKLSFFRRFEGTLGQTVILAFATNLIVELLSRRSLIDTIVFVFTEPLTFLYNMAIIFTTLFVAFIFRHRVFSLILIATLWIAIGVVDFILLCSRTTPFTAVDITLLKSTITIIPHYLEVYHYIIAAIVLPLIIFLFIKLYKKAPVVSPAISRLKAAGCTILLTLSCLGLTHVGIFFGMLSENFGNLANAYHDYGLAYCFVNSVINTGIDKPKQYSKDVVDTIINSVNEGYVLSADDISPSPESKKNNSDNNTGTVSSQNGNSTDNNPDGLNISSPDDKSDGPNGSSDNTSDGQIDSSPADGTDVQDSVSSADGTDKPDKSDTEDSDKTDRTNTASPETPNIIMVQLESFFDPTTIEGAEFNADPVPMFRALMENYSSGFISVPSVGAGTANTEFEVITGMNLDFFGPGEYPYKTVLQQTTCESISFNLKNLGYGTHAIHNNDGTFYDRNLIFSQLGFDTFTSIEYMSDTEYTHKNWCKDYVLTEEIRKALESTEEQDFVYTISVQGHGAYPTEPFYENPKITLTLPEKYSEETLNGLTYYINQINEMDAFISELLAYLNQCGEDTVLVLFGDHLPGFGFEAEDLTNDTLFQTNYVIWSNFELEKLDKDLEAYQLYSYVFERLGLDSGIIPKFHKTQASSPIYLEQLEILEYDMLYGDLECYGGINPFTATDLQMGIDKISFSSYWITPSDEDDKYKVAVIGDNFTSFSNICINGEPVETTNFRSENLLIADNISLNDGDLITIAQIGDDGKILTTTNVLPFNPEEVKPVIK